MLSIVSVLHLQLMLKVSFSKLSIKHDDIMLLIDPETGKFIKVNNAAVNFYGYSREAVWSDEGAGPK